MSHATPTDYPINEILSARYSPYVFDADRVVSQADLESLFEAARWTMSCYNEQPWRYIVGVKERNSETWEQVLGCLVAGNQAWAQHAPVLALGLTRRTFERNGKDNPAARHDLGGASANLTVEAGARGLFVHQMLGIVPETAVATFDLPEDLDPVTGIAIGYPGDAAQADPALAERDARPRERRPLAELIVRGAL